MCNIEGISISRFYDKPTKMLIFATKSNYSGGRSVPGGVQVSQKEPQKLAGDGATKLPTGIITSPGEATLGVSIYTKF